MSIMQTFSLIYVKYPVFLPRSIGGITILGTVIIGGIMIWIKGMGDIGVSVH